MENNSHHTHIQSPCVRSVPMSTRTIQESAQISEQLRAELAESEQRFRATFEQAAVGIAHVALDGSWIYVNQKLCDIVGYSLAELQQLTFQAITHPEDLKVDLKNAQRLLEGDIAMYAMEKRYIRKDGSVVWVNLTGSLVRDAAATPLYFIAVIEDISERKQIEQELKELNQRFDEFISLASHELRNPLTNVKGNVQIAFLQLDNLCKKGPADTETIFKKLELSRSLLLKADKHCNTMTRLISDLLDVSRIQANKLEMHIKTCNLTEIVQEVVESQSQTAPDRTILSTLPEAVLYVNADADRLAQVIHNFIGNAFKYSPEEKPVQVVLGHDEATQKARVSVSDEGPGLTAEEQPHIWKRFYRVKGIMPHQSGTASLGLGLYICRTIIEHHQGEIGIDTAPGHGSTFWFTLAIS